MGMNRKAVRKIKYRMNSPSKIQPESETATRALALGDREFETVILQKRCDSL
jgi:hypothetical protein